MTDHLLHARLFNKGGELIAEGPCWVDEAEGRATLEPQHEPGFIQKERGELSLKLDSGRSLAVSDSPMIFKLGVTPNGDMTNGHRSLYRLRLLRPGAGTSTSAQEANAAGAVAEGSTTPPQVGLRSNGETPAAR
ncbi:MAG: hypothetical protein IIB88_07210 [Chloroflexi bacterium]|nr:hypothetical protein [Chloroflexota bacterium]